MLTPRDVRIFAQEVDGMVSLSTTHALNPLFVLFYSWARVDAGFLRSRGSLEGLYCDQYGNDRKMTT